VYPGAAQNFAVVCIV